MRVILRICDERGICIDDERGICLDVRHRPEINRAIIELAIDQAVKLGEAINDTVEEFISAIKE